MKPTDLPHTTDEDGEHNPSECYPCLAAEEVHSDCRCGECCRRLILEVLVEDAEVEPKIKERCSPLYEHPQADGERDAGTDWLSAERRRRSLHVFGSPDESLHDSRDAAAHVPAVFV